MWRRVSEVPIGLGQVGPMEAEKQKALKYLVQKDFTAGNWLGAGKGAKSQTEDGEDNPEISKVGRNSSFKLGRHRIDVEVLECRASNHEAAIQWELELQRTPQGCQQSHLKPPVSCQSPHLLNWDKNQLTCKPRQHSL